MTGSRQLLVLGLDAASPPLLRSLAADGTLPNIARLMATGLVGDTRNVEAIEAATWPSFFTGLNPGRHGFYWQQQLKSGTYRIRECAPADFCRKETLWETVSAAGHRVVVLDVPLSHRSTGLNGVQSVEWGGHDRVYGFQSTPRGFKETILRTAGDYPIRPRCDAARRSVSECREFADRLIQGAGQGARLARRVLADEPWDFAMHVFGESHCAGHQLWHFHDSAHPGFDLATTQATGNLVREVYAALDAAVGEVLSGLNPDTKVVLLSLHGMTHTWGASILLPEILTRLGHLNRPLPESQGGSGAGGDLPSLLRAAYHRVPEWIRGPAYDLRQYMNQRWLRRGTPLNLDPQRTRCFPIHVGRTYSGIRLNLRGREPQGTLSPGREAEQFCAQLIEDLLAITQSGTGTPLVRTIHRTATLFHGPQLEQLPDLVVDWNPELTLGTTVAGTGKGAVLRASSPRLGSIEGVNTYCRTGDHQLGGMFVAGWPGLAPGKLGRVVSNLDLAPTFARLMGCEMRDVDGQPIPELLDR